MARISVVNESMSCYNLAVDKIAGYHRFLEDQVYAGGWQPMSIYGSQKVYFSVIYTWDLPGMVQHVLDALSWGCKVEVGGPAATFLPGYIQEKTGIVPHLGLDPRFEHMPGDYQMTFTSRGCIHSCPYCGVKLVEPDLLEYRDYPLAPMVSDNNILATSREHQIEFVEHFMKFGRRIDINSGFDCRLFQEHHFRNFSQLDLFTWRFAFDQMDVERDFKRVAKLMRRHGFDRHNVTVYALLGFPGTTPEENLYRLDTIIKEGLNPYPMRYFPINRVDAHRYVAPGFTEEFLFKAQTYYISPFLWKAESFENFKPGKNKQIVKARGAQPSGNMEGLNA